MDAVKSFHSEKKRCFTFIGEAGSGKSEIAINFAKILRKKTKKEIHFFDFDMSKSLFRAREAQKELESAGISVHFEKQFMDAPTQVGGLISCLKEKNRLVVLDVGGDAVGSRAIGGFAKWLNAEYSLVYFVVNPYRPWSSDLRHIDETLGSILRVTHLQFEKLHLISNPNLGITTLIGDVVSGHRKLKKNLESHLPIDFLCVKEELADQLEDVGTVPILPLKLALSYEWTAK